MALKGPEGPLEGVGKGARVHAEKAIAPLTRFNAADGYAWEVYCTCRARTAFFKSVVRGYAWEVCCTFQSNIIYRCASAFPYNARREAASRAMGGASASLGSGALAGIVIGGWASPSAVEVPCAKAVLGLKPPLSKSRWRQV